MSYQQEVGTGYFDDVSTVIQGGSSSVKALTGSTEEEPSVQAEVNWCKLARVASDRGSSIDGQGAHWHNMPMHLSEEIGMPTRNVVLTNYQASFVERLVSTGRYQNASEVLREGLRMVEQREAEDASRLEALRSAVRVGVDDFEQGRYATFESGTQLRGHLASLASKTIAGV